MCARHVAVAAHAIRCGRRRSRRRDRLAALDVRSHRPSRRTPPASARVSRRADWRARSAGSRTSSSSTARRIRPRRMAPMAESSWLNVARRVLRPALRPTVRAADLRAGAGLARFVECLLAQIAETTMGAPSTAGAVALPSRISRSRRRTGCGGRASPPPRRGSPPRCCRCWRFRSPAVGCAPDAAGRVVRVLLLLMSLSISAVRHRRRSWRARLERVQRAGARGSSGWRRS